MKQMFDSQTQDVHVVTNMACSNMASETKARAVYIGVPIKIVNPGLWDRLAQGAHDYGMTVDEYCNFLLAKEYAPELLRQPKPKQDIKVRSED